MTREAGTSQPARRPGRRRLSATHLLIGGVVALAFLLNFLALQDRDATVMVAVADRPLAAGSMLSASDLRFIPIAADFEAIDSLLSETGAAGYEGWVLRVRVGEGELIEPTMLAEPGAPAGLRSMSLPVPVEHAAGGTLAEGDRIDVISVEGGVAGYVVVDIEVVGVAERAEGSFGVSGDYHVIVAVDSDQALALARAIDSGSIEVVRSTGAGPPPDVGWDDDEA